jgi:hypothetical protein
MSLTDKAEEMVRILENANLDVSGWSNEAAETDSYYKKYEESKHIGDSPLMEYDFATPVEFKAYLDRIWNDGEYENIGGLKRLFMKLMMESADKPEKMLPDVDTYNYMM